MKKIYSKITKERQKQFQIETYITQDGDEKQVVKKALTPECIEHIQGMQRYYEKHRSAISPAGRSQIYFLFKNI